MWPPSGLIQIINGGYLLQILFESVFQALFLLVLCRLWHFSGVNESFLDKAVVVEVLHDFVQSGLRPVFCDQVIVAVLSVRQLKNVRLFNMQV